jgi:hypothetical protein
MRHGGLGRTGKGRRRSGGAERGQCRVDGRERRGSRRLGGGRCCRERFHNRGRSVRIRRERRRLILVRLGRSGARRARLWVRGDPRSREGRSRRCRRHERPRRGKEVGRRCGGGRIGAESRSRSRSGGSDGTRASRSGRLGWRGHVRPGEGHVRQIVVVFVVMVILVAARVGLSGGSELRRREPDPEALVAARRGPRVTRSRLVVKLSPEVRVRLAAVVVGLLLRAERDVGRGRGRDGGVAEVLHLSLEARLCPPPREFGVVSLDVVWVCAVGEAVEVRRLEGRVATVWPRCGSPRVEAVQVDGCEPGAGTTGQPREGRFGAVLLVRCGGPRRFERGEVG